MANGALFDLYGKKRRVFFSFHYDDILRVNNVRNCGQFNSSDSDIQGFYDHSLWEQRKLEGPESIKNLIRSGVEGTSVVCVLIGTGTWSRRWVRYEIARAIIEERGLLGVHINGLSHHTRRLPDRPGENPLNYLGIRTERNGLLQIPRHYLAEYHEGKWRDYQDYKDPVSWPIWLRKDLDWPVIPLGASASLYDFTTQRGHLNIGTWIDEAASAVGR